MASSPDENDMSWEETHAIVLFSAESPSNKRTFGQYAHDHPEPHNIPIQRLPTYRGPLPPPTGASPVCDPCLFRQYVNGVLTFVTGTANYTKRRLVSVARRRLLPVSKRCVSRIFRQIRGQQATVPITPPRFRPMAPHQMPGSYPASPDQPAVPYPSPTPMPMATSPSPSPSTALGFLLSTAMPGTYPSSPTPPVEPYPSPEPALQYHNPPYPSPSEISSLPPPPALHDFDPPHPSPSEVSSLSSSPSEIRSLPPSPAPQIFIRKETPPAVRELRKILKKYSARPQSPLTENIEPQEAIGSADSSPLSSLKSSPLSSVKSSPLRSKKLSPLSEQPSKGNVQNAGPSPLKKTVTFPDSPVTRTKRYVVGETISYPSPTSSFDENSMLSVASSPVAQWASPTQEEQQHALEEQWSQLSPAVSVSRRLFVSTPSISTRMAPSEPYQDPDHSSGDNSNISEEMLDFPPIVSTSPRLIVTTPSMSMRMAPSEPHQDPDHFSRDSSKGNNQISKPATAPSILARITPSEPPQDPDNSMLDYDDMSDQVFEASVTPSLPSRMAPSEPLQVPDHSSGRKSKASDQVSHVTRTPSMPSRMAPSDPYQDPDHSSGRKSKSSDQTSDVRRTPSMPSRMAPSEPQQDPDHSSGDETEASDQMSEAAIISTEPVSGTPKKVTRTDSAIPEPDVATLMGEIALEATPKNKIAGRRGDKRSAKKARSAEKLRAEKAAKLAAKKEQAAKAEAAQRAEEERAAAEERALREKARQRRMPVGNVIQPLPAQWDDLITAALAKPMNAQVATSSTATPILRSDIGRVLPQAGKDPANGWLNDEVINAYLQAVVQHAHTASNHRRGATPKMHAFNPFFWSNLNEFGPEKVSRWAAKAKIGGDALLKVDHVFIPVNRGGNHWTIAVVSPSTRMIEYFDSFHGRSYEVVGKIEDWLRYELKDLYHHEEWTEVEDPALPGQGKGPRQHNMSDCGVFAVTTAKMVALGVDPMAVSARDMALQRRRIVAELLNGGFTGDFEPQIVFQ